MATRKATAAKKAAKKPATKKAQPASKPEAAKPRAMKRTVSEDNVNQAIKIRENGGTWSDVEEATGFNGAILRPHMKRAGFDPEQVPVKGASTPKGIAADRERGCSWYALSLKHGISEAEARKRAEAGGCSQEWLVGRKYLTRVNGSKPAAASSKTTGKKAAKKAAKKVESKTPAQRKKERQAAAAKGVVNA